MPAHQTLHTELVRALGWSLISGAGDGNGITGDRAHLVRVDFDQFERCEFKIPGEHRFHARGRGCLIIATVLDGTVTIDSGASLVSRYHPGDIFVANHHFAQFNCVTNDIDLTAITLSAAAVGYAGEPLPLTRSRTPQLQHHPIDARACRWWKDATRLIDGMLTEGGDVFDEATIAAAGNFLAALGTRTLLPPTERPRGPDQADTTPSLLKSVMDFCDANISRDISVVDMADAVHLTPRALQYMVRRHLNCTPTEYLRRIRLVNAHNDLVQSHRATSTVGTIANRWGFHHTGRFAVLYRETYGQSPHTTLRMPPRPGEKSSAAIENERLPAGWPS